MNYPLFLCLRRYWGLQSLYNVFAAGGEDQTGLSYNESKHEVNVGIGDTEGPGLTAHELLHAFQFDKQQLSITLGTGYGRLIDIQDETAGYNRERAIRRIRSYFETPNMLDEKFHLPLQMNDDDTRNLGAQKTPQLYQNLPVGPLDLNSPEGKQLRNETIEAGKNKVPVKEIYRGWEKDYESGQKK